MTRATRRAAKKDASPTNDPARFGTRVRVAKPIKQHSWLPNVDVGDEGTVAEAFDRVVFIKFGQISIAFQKTLLEDGTFEVIR